MRSKLRLIMLSKRLQSRGCAWTDEWSGRHSIMSGVFDQSSFNPSHSCKYSRISNKSFLIIFCCSVHTRNWFFSSYAQTSIILMSERLSNSKNFILALSTRLHPLRFLIHSLANSEKISFSHRISNLGENCSLWAECVWHVDWLWFSSVSSFYSKWNPIKKSLLLRVIVANKWK